MNSFISKILLFLIVKKKKKTYLLNHFIAWEKQHLSIFLRLVNSVYHVAEANLQVRFATSWGAGVQDISHMDRQRAVISRRQNAKAMDKKTPISQSKRQRKSKSGPTHAAFFLYFTTQQCERQLLSPLLSFRSSTFRYTPVH